MTKQEKAQVIKNLTEDLKNNKNIYLTEMAGLDAVQTVALRRACFKENIKLAVVKNTLLAKAMEASDKDFGTLADVLKGNTSLLFSEGSSAPAKLIKQFRKKSEKPILKGAYVEESVYVGDNQLDVLATIKSKEELIGDVILILQSPAKNVVSSLQSAGCKLSAVLKALSDR